MHVVIGSTTVDLFVTGMQHIPALGGDEFSQDNLVFTDSPLQMTIGGNGANSAYVLGRLGENVRLCSAVGDDELGAVMCRWLAEAGVDASGLSRVPDAGTSTTTIVMDASLNRSSFHHGGAYAAFTPNDLPATWLDNAESLLLSSFPLMAKLRPIYGQLLADAGAANAITVVDIGPAIGEPATIEELAPLLPMIDYLVANEHELSVCCGIDQAHPSLVELGSKRLLAEGATAVIVKHGGEGATLCRKGEARELVSGFAVAPRSTVGAGDSFNAGLLWALTHGRSPIDAVQFANATAALVVASPRGVLDGPAVTDVQRLVKPA